MSNILIIKHGSLGDLIQANGAINDIKNSFKNSKVILLTSKPYALFMSECPYIDGVITDRRLPRWNLMYLYNLKKLLSKYNFTHVFDLQNSNRTKFYRKYILKNQIWSSTETTLEIGQNKKQFDKDPVLDRMEIQLNKSNIKTSYIKNLNLNWAIKDLSRMIRQFSLTGQYILIFPFCSKKHLNKKWPYFKELVVKLKENFKNEYPILIAPGPGEIEESKKFNAKIVLNDGEPINIISLISLIHGAKFIISNDTGPAHIASHLNKKGLVLFGSHTSPKKVSIESNNLKTLSIKNLNDLNVEIVLNEIRRNLN